MAHIDEVAKFIQSSPENRRLFRQEELILDITELLAAEMNAQGVTQKALSEKLGCTKGYVSHLLSGGKNLTLRSLANLADALDCRPAFALKRNQGVWQRKLLTAASAFSDSPRWQAIQMEEFQPDVIVSGETVDCSIAS